MGRDRGPTLIVLDTHVWLWWCNGSKHLSRRATAELRRHETLAISAISCWELTMLERQRRIEFDRGASTWLRHALSEERLTLFPVTAEIAIRAGQLHGVVPEPADAIIYATAVEQDVKLLTRDRALHDVDPSRTLW